MLSFIYLNSWYLLLCCGSHHCSFHSQPNNFSLYPAGHYKLHEAEYRTAVDDILKKALVTFCHRNQLKGTSAAWDQEYKIAHCVCNLHNVAANSNESLRRVANSPSDHFFLPSSKDHHDSREPDSLIEEQKRSLPYPARMEPQGVLGQIMFDVCVPKNVEGWDIKPTVSPNGRPTLASARQLGPFNPIKYLRRSRL